jgi:release factor glutamine methyltransferase
VKGADRPHPGPPPQAGEGGKRRVGEALAQGAARLASSSDSARADAEILLAHVLGLTRAQLFSRLDEPVDPAEFNALVARRARGEPVAYITGEKGFWTLALRVTPAVLVPRPETELLVEWALELLREVAAPAIADLATGSGAIALALGAERPDARIVATDVSAAALKVARLNLQDCGSRNVELREGSWFEPLRGERFDLIVSNPPYVAAADEHLQALRHEPLIALTDGADGLNALRELSAGAASHLDAAGWLLVEHGHDQGAAVRALFEADGFAGVSTRRDFGDRERATAGHT